MRLKIAKIKQIIGGSLEFELEKQAKDLNSKQDSIHFLAPLRIKGQVENLGDRMFEIEGHIYSLVQDYCYRCLQKTKVEFKIDFSWRYSDIDPTEEDNDEDIYPFEGDVIDLLPNILDELILNWPGQVLCAINCKGLCSICGANLNEKTCTCERDTVDPRLSVLKQLLKSD